MTTNASAVYHPFKAIAGLPFSEAVQVGNLLFLSGQIGTDANGKLVQGGIAEETRHAMANIGAVLARHGSSIDRVVKVTVMLADIAEWPAMNAEYVKFFPNHFPARSAFAGSGLAMGARVEIECIALTS
jgi:2-iminobutanoate/2-iminopropanoate deaminase